MTAASPDISKASSHASSSDLQLHHVPSKVGHLAVCSGQSERTCLAAHCGRGVGDSAMGAGAGRPLAVGLSDHRGLVRGFAGCQAFSPLASIAARRLANSSSETFIVNSFVS